MSDEQDYAMTEALDLWTLTKGLHEIEAQNLDLLKRQQRTEAEISRLIQLVAKLQEQVGELIEIVLEKP